MLLIVAMNTNFRDKRRDLGLLILRLGIGLLFVLAHGLPKLKAGPQMWALLGGSFSRVTGIAFAPAFWGFMAMMSEFGGGLCLIAGVLFRPASALMLFTMAIAFTANIRGEHGFSAGAHASLVYGIVLLSFLFTGPGQLTLPALARFGRARQQPRSPGQSD